MMSNGPGTGREGRKVGGREHSLRRARKQCWASGTVGEGAWKEVAGSGYVRVTWEKAGAHCTCPFAPVTCATFHLILCDIHLRMFSVKLSALGHVIQWGKWYSTLLKPEFGEHFLMVMATGISSKQRKTENPRSSWAADVAKPGQRGMEVASSERWVREASSVPASVWTWTLFFAQGGARWNWMWKRFQRISKSDGEQ